MVDILGDVIGAEHSAARNLPLTTGVVSDVGNFEADLKTWDGPAPLDAAAPSASGLSRLHRIKARDLAVRAAVLGLKNTRAIHYTQGALRWQGIDKNLKAYKGQWPNYADCSAFVTWCIWNGLSHYGVRDLVNGQHWLAGWTGTMIQHGKVVVHSRNLKRGDAIIYGDPYGRTGHTALYIGGGLVISHGSEAGPMKLTWNYRPVTACRRYI